MFGFKTTKPENASSLKGVIPPPALKESCKICNITFKSFKKFNGAHLNTCITMFKLQK